MSYRGLAPLAALMSALMLAGAAQAAEGLQLRTQDDGTPRWQARLSMSSLSPNSTIGSEPQHALGSRILSANLLGDYYLTGSGFGNSVRGGLRATGGMLLGPLSLSQNGSAMSLGSLQSSVAVGQRSISLLSPTRELNDPSTSLSYLGIGYTGQLAHSGFSFSADLGMLGATPGLRLGSSVSNAQGLDDTLRDVRYKPVVQFGLSYSY
ncbi:hypothetical protein [Pelomonas sp. KK5]|uniref:hypothetical protein n=1 Tax=Pelomonas sp. KK5 TaxID=1855730 RepID=UPI00117EC314|nr:hypothetical protein [Pelomonas sp. KK5]